MSFASDLRADLDDIRAIPGDLGLRPYTVTLVIETWDGARVGDGTKTTTRTTLLVGGQPPKVQSVSQQDIVAGGYMSGDFKVGPFTPPFVGGGGYSVTDLDPPKLPNVQREVFYELVGPEPTTTVHRCEKVGDDADSALSTYLILRAKEFT
jgi:hypothetical protein